MVSRAYHDSLFMARVCPMGMIFIPCKDGISHHPAEEADPADAALAAEIILISTYAGQVEVRRVTVVQLAVTSVLSFLMVVPTNEAIPDFSWLLLCSALGLGAASAAIQVAMNWAQKSVSPTRATLIYAGEPVWAGVVGRIASGRSTGRSPG